MRVLNIAYIVISMVPLMFLQLGDAMSYALAPIDFFQTLFLLLAVLYLKNVIMKMKLAFPNERLVTIHIVIYSLCTALTIVLTVL